jgi:membrane protease YdiL (CAAX protease family)
VADDQGERKTPREASEPSRQVQLREVLVFLFLILPSMVLSFFVVRRGSVGFAFVAVASILRDLGLVLLILYFGWRNGEAQGRFGWRFRGRGRDVLLAILLFVPLFFGFNFLDRVLQAAGLSAPATPRPGFLEASGPAEYLLALVLVSVVALAEETIFRGYLILRLEAATGSRAGAVLLSSVIFSLGHGYEGTSGVVTVGCMGLVFAVIYLWRKSLVAPMVLHFLQDGVGIVLLPFLGLK